MPLSIAAFFMYILFLISLFILIFAFLFMKENTDKVKLKLT